jgi:leader peptidase (prepilin peptidase)/N-methyltransferase
MNASASYLGLDRPPRALVFALLVLGSCIACSLLFPAARAACGCIFLLGMIAGSCVDFDRMVIPDLFTVGLALAGIALSFAVPSLHGIGPPSLTTNLRSGAAALLGTALGSALGLWISILGELVLDREVLGFGDVKFLGAIGAFCGWRGAVFSVFGGAVVAAIFLVLSTLIGHLAVAKPRPVYSQSRSGSSAAASGWTRQFPFGPMLAIAAGLYFLALHPWVDRALSRYLILF